MRNGKIKKLVYAGMFTAVIALATALIKVPAPLGYVNLGDGMIFASAAALGPISAITAALGSLIADILLGYGQYAIATFVIKGLMGLFTAALITRGGGVLTMSIRNFLVFTGAEAIMIAGYFLWEAFVIYDVLAATGNMIAGLIQAAFGIAVGLTVTPLIIRSAKVKNLL